MLLVVSLRSKANLINVVILNAIDKSSYHNATIYSVRAVKGRNGSLASVSLVELDKTHQALRDVMEGQYDS